jgi:hypothetical protein
MNIADQVFTISGKEKKTLLTGPDSFRISNNQYYTVADFEVGWNERFFADTRAEIFYDKLIIITKEAYGEEVHIKYKGALGLGTIHSFTFDDENDYGRFFHFLQERLYMKKQEEQLSPLSAASGYLLGLIFALGAIALCYFLAAFPESGLATIVNSGKGAVLIFLIKGLGVTGVCVVGLLVVIYFICKINERYTHPPKEIRFLAANTSM